jgi:processive 1,2-diacylglycerol beta-glucosyltransferase
MKSNKKVLILYITEHSGHHSAALSIKKSLQLKDPGIQVLCVNAFRHAFPFMEGLIHALYMVVIKRVPKIWEKMYDNPKFVGRTRFLKSWIHALAIRRMEYLIGGFKPDVVVCTQAFPCGIVAAYKETKGALQNIFLMGVLTDFAPHAYWVYENVDAYVVPTQESLALLVDMGVAPQKVKVYGIPIDPKFSQTLDRRELLSNYGLKESHPVIMIMGGGHGLGPIRDVLRELDAAKEGWQLAVVCGLNEKLYRWIQAAHFKKRILSFRFTDQVERLMTMADVIITKPGGITTAEALAKKVPLIILNPIPGQEARNTEFLIRKGAAKKIDAPQEIQGAVRAVLSAPFSPFSLFDGVSALSKPSSSLTLAQFIHDL